MAASRARLIQLLVLGCTCLVACQARYFPMPAGLTPLNGTGRSMRRLQQTTGGTDYQMFFTDTPTACDAGSVTLGGRKIQVPANLVTIFPSQAFLWSDVLNRGDCTTLLVNIAANVMPSAGNTLSPNIPVAGTIDVDHLHAVIGVGYITSFLGGGGMVVSDPSKGTSPIKVYLNDPTSVYSDGSGTTVGGITAEPRFAVDPANQVVLASTGYPMCIPNTNCPLGQNRVAIGGVPGGVSPSPAQSPDFNPNLYPGFIQQQFRGQNPYQYIVSKFTSSGFDPAKPASFLQNDYVTYTGYWDPAANAVRAYSIQAGQLSLMTEPGYEPSYASFEDAISGTAGQKAAAAAIEQATRSRWEGVATDPWRPITVQAVDYSLGPTAYREYGMIMPDYGPLLGGVQYGRWRFRPPCTNALPDTGNKGCTIPTTAVPTKQKGGLPVNPYYPAPREVAVVTGRYITQDALSSGDVRTWFQNPTIEYLWAEGIPGSPPAANTFFDLPYLGGGYLPGATGPLSPFPTTALNTDANPAATFPKPKTGVQITDLVAGATWCSTSLNMQVCAWITVPAGNSPYTQQSYASEIVVYTLPYFVGSASTGVTTPSQFPVNFDFTKQQNILQMQPNSGATITTATGVKQAYCVTISNTARPSLPVSVVVRSNAVSQTPSIVGTSYPIPVNKIVNACITPTAPTGRYGFVSPPYTL